MKRFVLVCQDIWTGTKKNPTEDSARDPNPQEDNTSPRESRLLTRHFRLQKTKNRFDQEIVGECDKHIRGELSGIKCEQKDEQVLIRRRLIKKLILPYAVLIIIVPSDTVVLQCRSRAF